MNSQDILAALKYMYRGNQRYIDFKLLREREINSLKIKKRFTILVVFVQGDAERENYGHFLIFTVRKNKGKIINFQYFDSYAKNLTFYFENFPFQVESISHPPFQGNNRYCGFIILYFAALRTIYTFSDTIEYLTDLYNQAIVCEMALAHYHHISDCLTIRPYRKDLYFSRNKTLVIEYLNSKME